MTQNATQAKKSRSFTVGVSFRLSSYYSLVEILKKIKKTKNKTADFFVNTRISVNFFQKKAKITISLFMKNSRNNNIILGFSI